MKLSAVGVMMVLPASAIIATMPQTQCCTGLYARITTGIAYCNQYLAEAGDQDATKLAEVRFLRAYEYYSLMDAWATSHLHFIH